MVEQFKIPGSQSKKVCFSYSAQPGHTVALAGVFNDWDPAKHPMIYTNNVYSCTLELPPGKYEYKLVIDGEWFQDDENNEFVVNDFGTLNSSVTVKA